MQRFKPQTQESDHSSLLDTVHFITTWGMCSSCPENGLLWALNEITHEKHLEQDLAHNKYLTKVSCNYYYIFI